ncbi:MAG: MarR family transcriptional regulator [Bacteroidales bacterium]|jgi:DNA-binding MarR family transcriptional regulator|nr:MarR family transcriptional regulator [Bacteroidales bacterium]MDD2264589.1 MarR family transcriptional regulator [Bacteroidales bacterium]MDD2831972.1 MarR family transcriptional regulator [Bacteroidales bacterium]MDD3208975.1 MarR family transcriptional regulator [Bacteroidales bacterium]MDD3697809.1 MarR family transcriptional regulator [Bacteroidales bacterium]
MLLSKKIGVYLNQAHFLFKQCFLTELVANNVDLTPEQYLLIDLLWDEGPLTQQEIANQMQKDKNSITKLIDGLEKKGYVFRETDTEDRRKNLVVVTKMGQAKKQEITRIAIDAADNILSGIPTDELDTVVEVLNKLNKNMKNLLQRK